ncbi:MAG: methyltransferase [Planctomycetota bacterium]
MTIFKRQSQHYLILSALLVGVYFLITDAILTGQFLSVTTGVWLAIAIAIPIVHQTYVWLTWRSELCHGSISRLLGKHGFTFYAIGFATLIISRLVSITLLAISNRGTLGIDPIISFSIALILLIPSSYLIYSVHRYFGVKRAFGIDHFDMSYRSAALVKKGIFRYTDNGMYTVGLLIFWMPGLLMRSQAALLVAAFTHIYIWVHYYCTELPDIREIYGRNVKP